MSLYRTWNCWGIERKSIRDPLNEGWSGPLGRLCIQEHLPVHMRGCKLIMFETRAAAREMCANLNNYAFRFRPVRLHVHAEAD